MHEYTHTYTHTYTLSLTHTHTHTHTQSSSVTRTSACMHTCMHTHTHTHRDTHCICMHFCQVVFHMLHNTLSIQSYHSSIPSESGWHSSILRCAAGFLDFFPLLGWRSVLWLVHIFLFSLLCRLLSVKQMSHVICYFPFLHCFYCYWFLTSQFHFNWNHHEWTVLCLCLLVQSLSVFYKHACGA